MAYEPQSLDTFGIRLTSDIEELTEELAKHAHDVWGRQRISDGWTWGANRDDEAKQNPCLVPYEELNYSEQRFDRNAAIETLKAVLAKGYRIIHPDSGRQARPGNEAKTMSAAEGMLNQLRLAQENPASLELPVLLQVWNSHHRNARAVTALPTTTRI